MGEKNQKKKKEAIAIRNLWSHIREIILIVYFFALSPMVDGLYIKIDWDGGLFKGES